MSIPKAEWKARAQRWQVRCARAEQRLTDLSEKLAQSQEAANDWRAALERANARLHGIAAERQAAMEAVLRPLRDERAALMARARRAEDELRRVVALVVGRLAEAMGETLDEDDYVFVVQLEHFLDLACGRLQPSPFPPPPPPARD